MKIRGWRSYAWANQEVLQFELFRFNFHSQIPVIQPIHILLSNEGDSRSQFENLTKPARVAGMGRTPGAKDKANESRSDRFHSDGKKEIADRARWFARNRSSYTYKDIGEQNL